MMAFLVIPPLLLLVLYEWPLLLPNTPGVEVCPALFWLLPVPLVATVLQQHVLPFPGGSSYM